eukprot:NODE_75_length_23955_cov_0.435069.p20 type:complete len:123 gc:universal NODE_75_length_23955_cov_0.435069:15449-15817(+)
MDSSCSSELDGSESCISLVGSLNASENEMDCSLFVGLRIGLLAGLFSAIFAFAGISMTVCLSSGSESESFGWIFLYLVTNLLIWLYICNRFPSAVTPISFKLSIFNCNKTSPLISFSLNSFS